MSGKKSVWCLCNGLVDDQHHMPIPWPTIHALMSLAGLSPTADAGVVTNIDNDRWVADGKPPTKTYLDQVANGAQAGDTIILITEGHGYCQGANDTGGDAGVMMADGALLDSDLHDRLFTKLPKGCRLLYIAFGCDSGGLPMNIVWRVQVPDCANAKVEKIPGDESKIQADIACLCSSKADQLTMAGDLYAPIEKVAKDADVKKIGFCEFLARLQAVEVHVLRHPTILEAYFSSHGVMCMKVGDFLQSP